jgi:agmatine deiminase
MTQAEASGISELEGTLSRQAGEPVFGGYINFYIANGGVVVPQFGVAKDELACAVLQEAFPDRKIVGVQKAREISLGGGNIHCITQQQPLGNLAKT